MCPPKAEDKTHEPPEDEAAGTAAAAAEVAAAAAASMVGTPPDKKRSVSGGSSDAKSSKRSRDLSASDLAGEDDISPEAMARMSRSERKRHREKKRRSDVNKGFDDLMTLLVEIDPSVRAEAEERARRGQWKGQLGAQEDNLLSRVDLISRTVEVLRRVHRENEERKLIIASLTRGGAASAGGGLGSLGSTGIGFPAGASLGVSGDPEVSQKQAPSSAPRYSRIFYVSP